MKNNSPKLWLKLLSGLLFFASLTLLLSRTGGFPLQNFLLQKLLFFYLLFFCCALALSGYLLFLLFQKKLSFHQILTAFFQNTWPSLLIILLASNLFSDFHPIFTVGSLFYFIFLANFLVFNWLKKSHQAPKKKLSSKFPLIPILLLLVVILLRLAFGFNQLGEEYYSDESLWMFERIETFWGNVKEGDWLNTRPSDKPGVTVALVAGTSLIWQNPAQFEDNYSDLEALTDFFCAMRLPILLFSCFFVFAFYFSLRRLLDKNYALLAAILIGLSPLLLGISRLVNPDSLLWIFLPLALFNHLTFLLKETKNYRYLIASGIFLGLALLTKYIANYLIVFMLLAIFYQSLNWTSQKNLFQKQFKKSLLDYLSWLAIGITTFTLLFPGVWVKPSRILIGTLESQAFGGMGIIFGLILLLILAEAFFLKNKLLSPLLQKISLFGKYLTRAALILPLLIFFVLLSSLYFNFPATDFFTILSSPKSAHQTNDLGKMLLASFLPLFFGINLFSLIIIITASLLENFNRKITDKKERTLLALLWLFIFGYYFGSLFSQVVPTLRYQISLLPLILVIAALSVKILVNLGQKKFTWKKQTVFGLILILLCGEALFNLVKQKPYYFSFNNLALPQSVVINPKDMGEGSFAVAQWLNQQENAKELTLWTDRSAICKFFVGKCNDTRKIGKLLPEIPQYDFYVISSARENYYRELLKQKTSHVPSYLPRIDRLYEKENQPLFLLSPARRPASNYIKVLDAKKMVIDR